MTPERWRQIEERITRPVRGAGKLWLALTLRFAGKLKSCWAQDSESGDKLLDKDAADLIADTADVQLTPGTQLGPYKIEALLGQGAMGPVYRATDTRLERPVAFKLCKRAFLDRFLIVVEMATGQFSRLPKDPPPALERVIRRCLETDPDERWQSARDLQWELESILQSQSNQNQSHGNRKDSESVHLRNILTLPLRPMLEVPNLDILGSMQGWRTAVG